MAASAYITSFSIASRDIARISRTCSCRGPKVKAESGEVTPSGLKSSSSSSFPGSWKRRQFEGVDLGSSQSNSVEPYLQLRYLFGQQFKRGFFLPFTFHRVKKSFCGTQFLVSVSHYVSVTILVLFSMSLVLTPSSLYMLPLDSKLYATC